MYSAYKLNKQGDNIQPWGTPFPIWNQSVVPCPVLTVASWPAYRFLERQVRWSGIPISFRIFQFVVIHRVKVFSIVNEAEVDVFLELSYFFYNPADVCNLIFGSSAFSKSSLNIWEFSTHVLLKPGLENFKCCFASVWDECSCVVVWAFFGIAFLWDWNESWPFPGLWPLLSVPAPLVIQTQDLWLCFLVCLPDAVSSSWAPVSLPGPYFFFSLLLLPPLCSVCYCCTASHRLTQNLSSLTQDTYALISGFRPLACASLEDEALSVILSRVRSSSMC